MASRRSVFSLSEQETLELGRSLAAGLRGGELIVLEGELGLGKTVFARGIAVGLDIDPREVSSPSYTVIQEYPGGRLPMFHLDLYRIEDASELETLGLEDLLGSGAVLVVEWGERLPASYRKGAFRVRFHDIGEDSRQIELVPGDELADEPLGDA